MRVTSGNRQHRHSSCSRRPLLRSARFSGSENSSPGNPARATEHGALPKLGRRNERRHTVDGLAYRGSIGRAVVPTLHVGVAGEFDASELPTPDPSEMGDIGDREVITGCEFRRTEGPVEHRHDASRLSVEARQSMRNLLGSLLLEMTGLPEGGPNSGDVEENLLEHTRTSFAFARKQFPGLFGKIDKDGRGFGQNEPFAIGARRIDEYRYFSVRIECPIGRVLLLTLPNIDGLELVLEPHFLERDRHSNAIGGRKRIYLEHDSKTPFTA